MRIGLVSYEYPPQQGLGGVGTYMFRLAGALGRAGHEVHVIAGPSDLAPVAQPNVSLHRIPAHYEIHSDNRALRWMYWQGLARFLGWVHPAVWHWIKWDLASYDAIDALDRAHPFDLIEVPEHAANGWMAGHLHRWPIVIRMHCPWELFVRVNRFPFNPLHRVLSHLERLTVKRYADGLTVPSEAMRRAVVGRWELRREPTIIPNFMDVPEQAAPLPAGDGVQRIVCVGRVEPLKGQDTLAQAFAAIASRHPRARLTIVGPDRWPGRFSFADLLPRLVPDPAIRARIDLPGAVPLDKVAGVLRTARVAVTASRGFESFSLSTLEAMAVARPIITTDAGALPELVLHEQTGLVVPASDPARMAAALDRVLDDRRGSEELGRAGFERARQTYHTPRVLPQIMSAYGDASDFYYQVRSAGSERTARQWRRSLSAAAASLDAERAAGAPDPLPPAFGLRHAARRVRPMPRPRVA